MDFVRGCLNPMMSALMSSALLLHPLCLQGAEGRAEGGGQAPRGGSGAREGSGGAGNSPYSPLGPFHLSPLRVPARVPVISTRAPVCAV